MKEAEFLERIESLLKEESFDCSLEPDVRAPPFGRILVFLGTDLIEREKIMEITAQCQDLGEALKEPPEPSKYIRVQFEICLPFRCQDDASAEVACLLAFFNRMLELPGFELDEVNSKIYYRYVHLAGMEGVDKTLVTGLIGAITLLIEMFSEVIERVSRGKSTFNEVLEEMLQIVEKSE